MLTISRHLFPIVDRGWLPAVLLCVGDLNCTDTLTNVHVWCGLERFPNCRDLWHDMENLGPTIGRRFEDLLDVYADRETLLRLERRIHSYLYGNLQLM